jgi:hypothetical protein
MSGEKLDELRQVLQQEEAKRASDGGLSGRRLSTGSAGLSFPSGSHASSKVAVTTHKGAEPGPRSVWPRELPPGGVG